MNHGNKIMSRKRAILALLLLVPAPSLGVLFGMVVFPNSLAGILLFGASKLWLIGLPLVWLLLVERAPLSLSLPRRGGFVTGIVSGVLLSGLILGMYSAMGDSFIDRRFLVDKLTAVGLGSGWKYGLGAAYWILVNSVLEEYVWRWFCVEQCERLFSRRLAVVLSALFFTLHHIVAMAVYLGPATVAACAFGVFVGGATWSVMYIRYRSIWPCYLSHALVDLCIFGIGAAMLFGPR